MSAAIPPNSLKEPTAIVLCAPKHSKHDSLFAPLTSTESKCMMCAKAIFEEAFTEVSNDPTAKIKRPICSLPCFRLYISKPVASSNKPPVSNLKPKELAK